MKFKIPLLVLASLMLFSCDFSKSVNKDLVTGLSTAGDGLSCKNVYLSDGENKLSRNTFVYGETFYVNFDDIKGFNKTENHVFPGMQLYVLSQAGDTVMKYDDLYADSTGGLNYSPLLLKTILTAAKPIHSNSKYKFHVNIWDKKGEGNFKANMDFDLVPNEHILVESKGITYNEIYLFSQKRKITITENKAKLNEEIYMIFEGLEGFVVDAEKVSIGLSIVAKDAEGRIVLNETDLVGESDMESAGIKSQLAPNFTFLGDKIKNPVDCNITIWDKKGENKIKASVKLNLEK